MTPGPLESLDIDVIIVAHDSGELLLDAIASVIDHLPAQRVHVVDAESSDGAVEQAAAAFPGIIVHQVENRGFAAANNTGIQETTGEFVLLLNPDAKLLDGAWESLLDCAVRNSDAGIVGGVVVTPSGVVQDGAWGKDPSVLSLAALRARRLIASFTGRPVLRAPSREIDVDWVTGACMLVRRRAIDRVGLMDESYFLYFEDLAWCRSMRNGGWRVVLEPGARILHVSGSSGGTSEFGAKEYRKSFWRYVETNGLWGLSLVARVGLALRRSAGGAS